MRRVIIESPYRGEVSHNRKYARRAILHSLLLGEAPIASHLLYTQPGILLDDVPNQRDTGIRAGRAWIEVADAVIFYMDRGASDGMLVAERVAKDAGITVEYRYLDRTDANAGTGQG